MKKIKKILAFMLSFFMVITNLPAEIFAAGKPTTIKKVVYDVTYENNIQKSQSLIISGEYFRKYLNPGDKQKQTVVDDIIVDSTRPESLMSTDFAKNIKTEISDSIIRVQADAKTGYSPNLNINAKKSNTIKLILKDGETSPESKINPNGLVTLSSLDKKKYAVGEKLEIHGQGFEGVKVIIGGVSQKIDGFIIENGKKTGLVINSLKKPADLNKPIDIEFVKEEKNGNISITRHLNAITVYEKLPGLDNMQVVPTKGPVAVTSKITVTALDENNKIKDDVMKPSYKIVLRNRNTGEEMELRKIKLNKKAESNKVESISGWTVPNKAKPNSLWDVVIKDSNNVGSEATAKTPYKFVSSERVPRIIKVDPNRGSYLGGTEVMIHGQNILYLNEEDLDLGNAKISAENTIIQKDENEKNKLKIKYDKITDKNNIVKYANKNVKSIERTIWFDIASETKPKTTSIIDTKPQQGKFDNNYMLKAGAGDGIVITTTNSSVEGWQDVILNMETKITYDDKDNTEVIIYESAIAEGKDGFEYINPNPTPVIDKIELEYGYFNDTKSDEMPIIDANTSKTTPLVLRIYGDHFQYIKGNNANDPNTGFPKVNFYIPTKEEGHYIKIESESSPAKGDTKILKDENGVLKAIDGTYEKEGEILIVSIIPKTDADKEIIRERFQHLQASPAGYKNLKTMVEVINPTGNSNKFDEKDGPFFDFRRPDETNFKDNNPYQISIEDVRINNSSIKNLPSSRQSTVKMILSAPSGIKDINKLKVTLDGVDITKNIKSKKQVDKKYETEVELDPVRLNLRGKVRLQAIIEQGLMDSYTINFTDLEGPEIKVIVPPEGNNGTIVVIKRDDINNKTFVKPDKDGKTDAQKIGSKVIIDDEDVNKNEYGDLSYKESDIFKEFIKKDENSKEPGKAEIPGKYVYVADDDTIYLWVPDNLTTGKHNIQIQNPDGMKSSMPKTFYIKDKFGSTKIGTINPNIDDKNGGIVTTITAANLTGFKPSVDVYFGSQKGEVLGYNVDKTEVYVKVPPLKDFKFSDDPKNQVYSYSVPVTVQNTEDKSTDTKINGFTYLNPGHYQMSIDEVRNKKYLTDDSVKQKNIGVKGDEVVITGGIFFAQAEFDEKGNIKKDDEGNVKIKKLPNVLFGYTSVPAEDIKIWGNEKELHFDEKGRAVFKGLVVKVPKKPDINVGKDGSVDVTVQNPDGRKAVKEKGFIYQQSKPEIIQEQSRLEASRFKDTIVVSAKDVIEDGLIVAFGNKSYKKPIVDKNTTIITDKQIENIVVKYNSEKGEVEFSYKKPDGTYIPLNVDWQCNPDNKVKDNVGSLKNVGDKFIVGIDWRNKELHSTGITENEELLKKLNMEFMEVSLERESNTVNVLKVRRGLGKVKSFFTDSETGITKLTIDTPYNDRVEKTTINLINYDGSVATAPFYFHGGIEPPLVTDIIGSKNIKVNNVNSKVYSTDMNVETEITIVGENLKDIQKITIGDREVDIISVSPDYKSVKVKVAKGSEDVVGKYLPVVVYTKQGAAYSDKRDDEHKDLPPVYFTYIQAFSNPVITSIVPQKGPQTGGTKVRINGTGFSEKNEFGVKGNIEVYFADKKATVDRVIKDEYGNIKGLDVITPSVEDLSTPINVYVKNPDKARSESHEFNYISQPVVTELEGDFIFNAEKSEEDVKVVIKGKNFYNPKKIIIGGKLIDLPSKNKEIENGMLLGVNSDGTNHYVQLKKDDKGNVIGLEIPVDEKEQDNPDEKQNTTSFTVTLPIITYQQMKKIETQNLIVVNEDGGTSPEKRVKIVPPLPKAPVIIATPGYNNTVNLKWKYNEKELNKATKFEIYLKEFGAENDYKHVGDIMKNQKGADSYYNFVAKNLKPDIRYQFKVRVMNMYGEAKDFGYATVRTLNPRDDHKLQEKLQELDRSNTNIRQYGTAVVVGDTLKRTVGTKETVINLLNYPNIKQKDIRISAAQIRLAPNSKIQIIDKNVKLEVPFSAFNLNQVNKASNNAVVSIKLKSGDNRLNTLVSKSIPRNKKRVSQVQKLDLTLEEPKKKYPIYFTNSPLKMTIIPNQVANNKKMVRYNEKTGKIENLYSLNIKNGGSYAILGSK